MDHRPAYRLAIREQDFFGGIRKLVANPGYAPAILDLEQGRADSLGPIGGAQVGGHQLADEITHEGLVGSHRRTMCHHSGLLPEIAL
jgi:hypothetical protein